MSGERPDAERAAELLREADAVLLDVNGTLCLDEDLLEPCDGADLEPLALARREPGEYADFLRLSELDIAAHLL